MEIFRKLATATDVNSKLVVPVEALKFLPDFGEGHGVEILVRDHWGVAYPIRCLIRREGPRKPVFSAGWKKFVDDKGLRVGDMITFLSLEDDAAGVHYKIVVKREIPIMGSRHWGPV